MVLLVDDRKVEDLSSLHNLVQLYPSLLKNTVDFMNQPVRYLQLSDNVLCIPESEYVLVASPSCSFDYLASTDATTCLVIAVLDKATGAMLLMHYNGSSLVDLNRCLLHLSQQGGRTQTCFILGAYRDEKTYSVLVVDRLLHFLQNHPLQLDLRVLCTGEINTSTEPSSRRQPTFRGLAVHLPSGDVCPVEVDARCKAPVWERRLAMGILLRSMYSVYDTCSGTIHVPPLQITDDIGPYRELISVQDDVFLRLNSTSPDCESQDFVGLLKAAYTCIIDLASGRRPNRRLSFAWDRFSRVWVETNP